MSLQCISSGARREAPQGFDLAASSPTSPLPPSKTSPTNEALSKRLSKKTVHRRQRLLKPCKHLLSPFRLTWSSSFYLTPFSCSISRQPIDFEAVVMVSALNLARITGRTLLSSHLNAGVGLGWASQAAIWLSPKTCGACALLCSRGTCPLTVAHTALNVSCLGAVQQASGLGVWLTKTQARLQGSMGAKYRWRECCVIGLTYLVNRPCLTMPPDVPVHWNTNMVSRHAWDLLDLPGGGGGGIRV